MYWSICAQEAYVSLLHFERVRLSRRRAAALAETHLERVVKVGHLAQRVEELVHARLVVVDERLQAHHVGLLGVARLVGQVLQHLGDLRAREERERLRR